MNERFELTPEALGDMRDIWEYIANTKGSPRAADRLWADLWSAFARLAVMPGLGHARKDLTPNPDVRFYRVRDCYLVIYLRATEPLQITRVLHGKRDVAHELEGD